MIKKLDEIDRFLTSHIRNQIINSKTILNGLSLHWGERNEVRGVFPLLSPSQIICPQYCSHLNRGFSGKNKTEC
jgi:hypothetical protein